MYCPECGKSNPEGLSNCQYCHSELKDNTSIAKTKNANLEKYASKIKKVNSTEAKIFLKRNKKSVVFFALILFIVVTFFVTGNVLSNPQRIVKKYFDSYSTKDFDTMYSLIDVNESEFINSETFSKLMEETSVIGSANVTNYKISTNLNSGSIIKNYDVMYVLDNGSSSSVEVNLVKTNKRILFFFSTYKVMLPEGMIHYNYKIEVPSGFNVELDDKPLQNAEENGEVSTFVIDTMFNGNHSIKISSPITKDYTESFYIDNYSDSKEISDFEMKEEAMDSINAEAKKTTEAIFNGAFEGKSFSELSIKIGEESNVESKYEEISSWFKARKESDYARLTGIILTDFDCDFSYNQNSSCSGRVFFYMTQKNAYKEGDEGEEKIYDDENSQEVFLTYQYSTDGTWILNNFDY